MARCSKCGIDVGCGCNLVNGLCKSCYNLVKNATSRFNKMFKLSVDSGSDMRNRRKVAQDSY